VQPNPPNNPFQIPELKPEPVLAVAPTPTFPFHIWGSVPRSTRAGTWGFYCDDWRFEGLWDDPMRLVAFDKWVGDDLGNPHGPNSVIETNFSVFDESPRAVAIWATYRKRFLSSLWQSHGVKSGLTFASATGTSTWR